MKGLALIALRSRFAVLGALLFIILNGRTMSAAAAPEGVRGEAGEGQSLGVANFSERAAGEQPVRTRALKTKPFRLRHPSSPSPLPIDPALVGRETSPRQLRKQAPTTPPSNSVSWVEADSGGSLFVPAGGGATPPPSASFPALLDDGFSSVPDTQGAVGPNHLLATLASQIRVQDRTGNTNLTMSLSNFWASTPGQTALDIFDPRVVYDPLGQRWIHVASANPGGTNPGLLVAVSQTTDPTGNWNRYFIDVDTENGIFVDSPNVGFTKDWITVSANMFDRTNFDYFSQDIWVFNKSRLYAGLSPAQFTHFSPIIPGGPVNVPVPVSTYDAANGTQYFVGHYDGDSGDIGYLRVYTISGAVGSEVFTEGAFISDIGVGSPPWNAFAPNDDNFGPQAGTTNKIYLGDARIVNGAYRESSSTLWVAHTIFLPANATPTHSAIQWWEFTPGGAVVQRGQINDPTAAKFFAYPSLAVSKGLDVVVGYSRFAANQFPSANYAYRVDDDLLSTLRPDAVLKPGEANYVADVNGFNVWGDWSAAAVDPANDTDLWTLQEYAAPHVLETNVVGSVTNVFDASRWGTWWGRISPIRDLTMVMTASPGTIMAGSNVTYSLSFTNARPPDALPQIVPGVRVVDTLPAGSVFVSAVPNQGSCAATGAVVTCNFGSLAAGATGRVTIVAALLNSGTAVNTATVSASGPDPVLSGNTVTVNTTVSSSADLALLMSDSPDPVTVSNQLVFTLTVTNRGPSSAGTVMVTNTLPGNVTYVSSNPSQGSCSRSGSIVTCTLGNIAAGTAVNVGVTVVPNATGLYTNRANVVTSAFDPGPSNNAASVVARANSAPVISIISDRTIDEDTTLGPLSFTVSDLETPAASLTLLGLSSNTNIVPNANIVFSGIGSSRMVTVTPAPNANGPVTITRIVIDADGAMGTNSFQLTITPVNDPPFLTDIANQTINEDVPLAPVAFMVGDIESGAAGLTVSGASSNPTLVPNASITIVGTGANRTVAVTPATNQFGTVIISISVGDGLAITNKTFLLTVNSVNDLPTMSDLVDRSVNEDAVSGPFSFTVGDVETAAGSLLPTGFSSNQSLVPNGNITFGGSGANRTVTVTPATNQFGTATITVSVGDGTGATNDTFVLTVNPVNDVPTLDTINNLTTNEDSGVINIALSGIGSGAANENQSLTVTASSSNPGLIPAPTITHTSPDPTGTLSFTPVLNSNGTATITVTVNDNVGSNNITTRMFNVTILPVNDPPILSDLTDRTINEDGSTNLSFTIGDLESPATSLTLLGRSSNPGIVPDANILFGGSGSNRTVTVTPAPNANGACIITVSVSDGQATNSDTFVLTVLPVNDPPTISTIADRSVNEDIATNISFSISDLETSVATLTVAATSANQALVPNLNLSVTGASVSRSLTVVPATNQFGSTIITLTVTDGQGATNATSFLLTVVPVNDAPTLDPIANLLVSEDGGQQTVNLAGISSGALNESQSLIVTASSGNPGLIPTPQVTYTSANPTGILRLTPVPDSNGVATITVTVNDAGGVNATFTRMFTVTVTNVNDPPSISDLADLTINEDAATNRTFTVGDIDNAASSLTLVAMSSNEELIVPGGILFSGTGTTRTVTLRTLTNQFGSATITIMVSDPAGATASDSFELTVLPASDPPGISSFSNVTVNEDAASNLIPFTVDSSEVLPSALTVRATSSNPVLLPTNNIMLGGSGANRNLRLVPVTNQFGVSLVTVIVSDGALSSSNSFQLTVLSINDLPSLSVFSDREVNEDTSTGPIGFTVGDLETAGGSLLPSGSSSDPALVSPAGFVFGGSGTSRTVSILPATNRFGSATITIRVADPDGGAVSNSFVLTVNPVNDPPVLNAVANLATNPDSGPVTIALAGIGPGGVGEVQSLSISASSSNPDVVPHPVVAYTSPAPTGSLMFTPVPSTNGSAIITVTVTDDAPMNNTFVRTFVVTTLISNRPPTLNSIGNRTISEDAGPQVVSFDGVSPGAPNEIQILNVTATSSNPGLIPTPTVTYTSPGTNGFLTFAPALNSNGTANITVTVNDNGPSNNLFSQMFTVTVTPVNDPPTLSSVTDQSTQEDTPLNVGVTVGDVDNLLPALVLSASSSNTNLVRNGSFAFAGSGAGRTVTITPVTNAFGSAVVTLSVVDGSGGSASNSFLLTVNPVADAPSISDIANLAVAEDSQPAINFTVSDPEGPAVALVLTATSSNSGLLPVSGIQFGGSGTNRSVTLKPLLNRFGSVTVTVVASAGSGASASDSFLLTVTNVNDAPTLSGLPNLTINEDTATGPLSITLGDLETPLGSLTPTGSSSIPSLVPIGNIVFGGTGPDRTVTLTPATNQFGVTFITLTLADGNGGSTNTSFVLNVAPVNDPPTLDAIPNLTTNKDPGVILVNLSGISAGGGESQTLMVTAVSGNPALIPNPVVAYTSPNPTGTLTLAPLANTTGSATITVTVNDGGGSNNVVTRSFTVLLNPGNDAPAISPIANQQVNEDMPLTTGFVIGDRETPAMSLVLSATSTDTTLVPNTNIFFSGSGSNRTITLVPATNQFGTTLITARVSDGLATNSASFVLTVNPVNDFPTLNVIPNYNTNSGNSGNHIVAINGISSGAANESQTFTIAAVSSNPGLLPNPGVSYSNPATNGTLTLRPANGAQGNATVTVTVTETGAGVTNNTVVRTFQVNIKSSGNVAPTMSLIPNQTMTEDTVLGPIAFTVGDSTTAAASLILRADSSNPSLLPSNNIIFGGSGASRNITLFPTFNQSGVALVFLTVIDSAFGSSNQMFSVTVNPANDAPAITSPGPQTAAEDTVIGPLAFTVTDIETPSSSLMVTASSDNPTLVPNGNIVLGGSGTNRAVRIIPAPNQSGSGTITLFVSDGLASNSTSFTVTWNPTNDPPTLSDIADQTINRDAATPALAFTVGDPETAADSLILTGGSSNPKLVPTDRIVFGGSGASRTVTVTPLANLVGTATITITVSDGTATAADTFVLTVSGAAVPNVPPTLAAIGNLNLVQNAPPQTVNLAGIGSGSAGEAQTLIVAASSSNPALIPNPLVTYTSPNTVGSLTLLPSPNASGTAVITVRVNDGQPQNNLVTQTFTVTVNAAPVITGPTNVVMKEDGTVGGIPFTLGDAETPAANLTVQVSSSNPALVSGGGLIPGGVGANRTLAVTPLGNQSGLSMVTLSAMDGNGNTSSNTFLITVVPVNDAPTLNTPGNLSVLNTAGLQSVNLSGISSGAADETQVLSIQATSDNPAVIPDPTITYSSPGNTGLLKFTPAPNGSGVAVITVKVMDDGGTGNGGFNSVSRTFTVTVSGSGGPPSLQIDRAGANVVLSWPTASGSSWVLQHNPSITNRAGWSNVGTAPVIVKGRYTVSVPAVSAAGFYRLSGGPPPLQIERAGGNVVLSWPEASGSSWVLQHNTGVTNSGGWSAVGTAPVIVKGRYTVSVMASSAARFYRLCSGCP